MSDEEAIRALNAQWADAVNRCDFDTFARLWTEDATWEIEGLRPVVGREKIARLLAAALKPHAAMVFLLHSGTVSVSGDVATARWYVSENARGVDGNVRMIAGSYDDEMVRTDTGWLFVRRYCSMTVRGVMAADERSD